jgi:hypothetical protein
LTPAASGAFSVRCYVSVRVFGYAIGMKNSVARSGLLVLMAMSVGLALGAVTKFAFGYDLPPRIDTTAQRP